MSYRTKRCISECHTEKNVTFLNVIPKKKGNFFECHTEKTSASEFHITNLRNDFIVKSFCLLDFNQARKRTSNFFVYG